MQETQFNGKNFQEYFSAPSDMKLKKKMDARLNELEAKGHTLVRRVPKIGRNEKCPCGSGIKFKKCCLNKVNLVSST